MFVFQFYPDPLLIASSFFCWKFQFLFLKMIKHAYFAWWGELVGNNPLIWPSCWGGRWLLLLCDVPSDLFLEVCCLVCSVIRYYESVFRESLWTRARGCFSRKDLHLLPIGAMQFFGFRFLTLHSCRKSNPKPTCRHALITTVNFCPCLMPSPS